jgi:hypothetical protein
MQPVYSPNREKSSHRTLPPPDGVVYNVGRRFLMRCNVSRLVVLSLLFAVSPLVAGTLPDTGTWSGALSFAGQSLRLVLHLSHDADGAWQGTMDSVDQAAYGIPLSSVSVDADTLAFAIATIGGSYRGVIENDGERIVGEWSRAGR